jgi:hypothetical protein
MTSIRKSSFDQDDLSTDTTNTHLSKNSELCLARIQQETHRLRKKRKEHRDSANSSDDDEPSSVSQQHHHKGTAAAAVAGRLVLEQQQQQTPQNPTANIFLVDKSFDSALSTTSATKLNWNEIVSSNSERSLKSEEETANNLTLKSATSSVSRNSHNSNINSITKEEKLELSSQDDDEDIIVLQRGDSIAKKNHFQDPPPVVAITTTTNSSTSLAHYYLSSKKNKKKTTMLEEHARKEDEAFQKKLIDEVLGKDAGDKVSMEKVVMIIWQFRDDKDVIKFMTRFVCKVRKTKSSIDYRVEKSWV